MIIADSAERRAALEPDQSFICEAPAGSGKTELLTQRYLVLLARVRRPEEILAITFTRKATGEMRERVLHALHLGRGPEPEEAHRQLTWQLARAVLAADQQHQWQLLDNPNRLQIKTFDSLCSSLTRQLPMESSFGSQPQITDDSAELYRSAVHALLGTLEEDSAWAVALGVVLDFLDNRFDRFEALMGQLLAKREQWLPLLGGRPDGAPIRELLSEHFATVVYETIDAVVARIPPALQAQWVELAAYGAANMRAAGKASALSACIDIDLGENRQLPDADALPQWLGLIELVFTQKQEWRKSVTVAQGFPSGKGADKKACDARKQQLKALIAELQSVPGLDDQLADILQLPAADVDDSQWQLLDALFTVLPMLSAQLTLVFKELNRVDFTEVSLAARRALGSAESPSQLAMKMDYRLSHILVDEFQDTSAAQVELLNQLTAGWVPDDGRTLFCVGDAMQSIYAFRGANVGLFLNAREQGLENVPLRSLRLTANFRSQAGVVHWVNKVFAQSFPAQYSASHGAVAYAASTVVNPELPGDAVRLHGFIDDGAGAREAAQVLDIILSARAEQPDAKIAVLVRSRSALAAIVPALQGAGLRYRAVDLEPLAETPAVQDLLSLTRALLHPADRVAWLAVLRAPWCGLALTDLDALCRPQESKLVPTVLEQCEYALANNCLSESGAARLARVLPLLSAASEQRLRKTFRAWVEGCWLALGGAASLPGAASLENARMFFRLLEKWEYASDLPAYRVLANAVNQLYAAPDPEADDSLQLMTVHKSKGLQFDVVIVPGLAKRGNSRSDDLMLWQERLNRDGESQLLMAPLTRASGGDRHANYQHLAAEAGKKMDLETCRLLYVACTRARQRLHLCFATAENSKNPQELRAPSSSSMLASIWQAVVLQVQRYPAPETEPAATESWVAPPLQRFVANWTPPLVERENLLLGFIPPYDYDEAQNRPELEWQSVANRASRHLGTLVHRYLQIIAEQGLEHWSRTRVHACAPAMAAGLRELGVAPALVPQLTERAGRHLARILDDERGRAILSNDYRFHASEYSLTLVTRSGPQQLVVDRVYTDAAGVTWIVDYKTAEPAEHEALDAFFRSQQELYQPKMRLYRAALLQAGFSQVRLALYFPTLAEWLELSEL
ncbi:UvrD-helicase domain-containing protein [Teredinibacter turnerae]|uniref:UvrD-helicase domain-containing protein n=1 Tax=Teredinibacter turnerae TaxID=2426 RepID=UPI00040AE118|nr:UvrD-helicase domain-containing protein [Teredinibacter turnerae]